MLHPPEKFETERLIIRKIRKSDANDIFHKYAKYPNATKYISWPTHKSIEDTYKFLETKSDWGADNDFTYIIVHKHTGEFIGSIGFVDEGGRVFIGYVIAEEQWGNGYTTEAARKILAWLQQQEGIFRIWALSDAENIGSIRILEKIGMIKEAKIEKWVRFVNQENQPKDCVFYVYPK